MRSYRVWEANRKVFLHPENWLHAELRDDKTPIFVDAETELHHQELSDDHAETVFTHYLERLDEVANLQVCGIHREVEASESTLEVDRLHVVARTRTVPRRYFYRVLEHGRVWTPWAAIDADIGDVEQVVVLVAQRRLYLIWAELSSPRKPRTRSSPRRGRPEVNPSRTRRSNWPGPSDAVGEAGHPSGSPTAP